MFWGFVRKLDSEVKGLTKRGKKCLSAIVEELPKYVPGLPSKG